MPDGRDESQLAWLVEPQRHDVALQQPIPVAIATREPDLRGAALAPAADAAPPAPLLTMAGTEVETPAPAPAVMEVAQTSEERRSPAMAGERKEMALEQRRAPLSVRLITVVRGTGSALGTLGAPRRTRPLSFMAQFVIAMVATVSLFTTLTLASPVAAGTPFHSSFESVAGAVPWIPTPTPTPRPTPTPVPLLASGYGQLPVGPLPPPALQPNPGSAAVQSYIRQVFGQWAGQALGVANCESGYNPNAWNPYELLRSHAAGVFQILYPSTWVETPYWSDNPFDYRLNILAAYWLFSRDGHSWREWACGTILGYNG